MASIWKLGSVDVYVLGHDESGDTKLAKLTVLDANATSVLHFFGSGAEEVSVDGWIFTDANKNTIEGYRNTGATIVLTSDQGSEGNFVIQDFKTKKFGPFVSLQLPGYDPDDTTIYKFTAKLIKQ
jgi:hypothetical protein